MRRLVLLNLSMMLASMLMGCGQSGDLRLPSDPTYDKRPSYLLYHGNRQEEAAASTDQPSVAVTPAVEQGH